MTLERIDWENVHESATKIIREAELSIISAKYMLERATAEIDAIKEWETSKSHQPKKK